MSLLLTTISHSHQTCYLACLGSSQRKEYIFHSTVVKFVSPPITSVLLPRITDDKLSVSCHDEVALSTSCHDRTDNYPIFTGSYKAKIQTLYPFLFFSLAHTSVYSNIIFCEVSWGEKQFGRPHCNLIHRLC